MMPYDLERLVDGTRLIQFRVKNSTTSECVVPSSLSKQVTQCHTPYSDKYKSDDTFGPASAQGQEYYGPIKQYTQDLF
jgi:hypothetical protein